MKSLLKHLTFITTIFILIVGVPLYSFAYTEAVYAPGYGAEVSHYTKDSNGVITQVHSTASKILKSDVRNISGYWVACDGNPSNPRQYDYYYASTMRIYDSPSYLTEASIIFDYDIDDFSSFNSFSFDVGVFGSSEYQGLEKSHYTVTATSNGEPVDLSFVLVYEETDWDAGRTIEGVTRAWRHVKVNVLLDKVYSYDTINLKFHVLTDLPAWNDTSVTYLFGASDMSAKLMDEQDWVTEIAGSVVDIGTKLDDTNTQLGIIGDTANDIKDQVTEAVDVLTQELTPEQQAKVDSVIDSIETRAEAENAVIDKADDVFDSLNNNSYDPFGETELKYRDEFDSLFESPFLDFWNFWWDPFIITFITISLGFAIAGFVLYGVR